MNDHDQVRIKLTKGEWGHLWIVLDDVRMSESGGAASAERRLVCARAQLATALPGVDRERAMHDMAEAETKLSQAQNRLYRIERLIASVNDYRPRD